MAIPEFNATYAANTVFCAGSQIGRSGWQCIFNGTTHSSGVTVTNLFPNTNYRVMVCEYNGNPGSEKYNISTAFGNPKTQKTGSSFICGLSLTVDHIARTMAPVNKTVTYGTIQSDLSGENKCWITQNLGADHQATTATDATEASAGWYWQFNRKQGYKHDGSTRTPNTTWITSINENSDWLPVNDPCTLLLGGVWRLPTSLEWQTADYTGGWDNYNETFSCVLKLHTAGHLDYSEGLLDRRGSNGYYWSSSQFDTGFSKVLGLYNSSCGVNNYNKAFGRSIRCLRD